MDQYLSPPNMQNIFDLKSSYCKLRCNYLLKLLLQMFADFAHKHCVLKEVFCGIRFKVDLKI